MQIIIKPAYNEEYRLCEFLRPDGQGQLTPDEIILSASILCTDSDNADVTSTMISNVSPNQSTQVLYLLKGGVAGQDYLMHIRIVTSSEQKLEEQFLVKVV